jgi:hypothetical protein
MLFAEKKITDGFNYWTEDVFGEVTIDSNLKLDAKMLDRITLLILKQEPGAETVNGEVRHDKGVVSYTLKRAPQWADLDDEELGEEICKNTPTSILERAKGIIVNALLMIPGFSWCKRFVEAFLEAWRRR